MGLRILIPRPRWGRSLGRIRKFVWVALGIALWGAAYVVFGASGYAGVLRARADVERLEQQVAEAREANEDLARQIRAVRSDPETIERLAREEFFLARPGEKIYLLPPLPPPGRTAGSTQQPPDGILQE